MVDHVDINCANALIRAQVLGPTGGLCCGARTPAVTRRKCTVAYMWRISRRPEANRTSALQ
jgi:hypothetical protein